VTEMIRNEFSPSPVAPALAREALDGWLSAMEGEQNADDIRAAASELVANAVRHGGLGADDVIILTGTIGDVIRIEVEQPSPVTGAEVQPNTDPAESGIGLRIVDKVAKRWGTDEGPPGIVWFEVDFWPGRG
jgi:anti-sigma regulatory factor (Ser/Thr protein kinase)